MRSMRSHMFFCFFLWGIWGIGLCLTGASLFFYQHNNDFLFWKIMTPYNQIVQIVSLIPIEPILCILAIRESKQHNKSYFPAILLCCVTFFLWLAYITLYVHWTGGV